MASNASEASFVNEEHDPKCWYHIIWLDKNMKNYSNQRKLKLLGEIDSGIKDFICSTECIDYLQEQNDRKTRPHVILIVSGTLSETVIPTVQDYTCIFAIFIFCTNSDNYIHLEYPKLRAICTDSNELMDSIEICIAKYNDTTDFSVFHSQLSINSGKLLIKTKNISKYTEYKLISFYIIQS
jgi:hypothetical protein